MHQPGVQPVLVRVLGRQRALDLGVVDDPPGGGVDEEHPARLQPALLDDRARRHVQHADLGGEHDQPVLGDPAAGGAQAVAVEHGADDGAVGEADQRGAVPRLHQRGVELVEGPAGRVHLAVVLPRLRDHHQHRVRQAAPAQVQQLEHLVEGRRVARVRSDDRGEPLQVAGDEVRGEQRLAGGHPVAVAPQGVDLTVVRDVAVGVGQRPRGERVRREPGVHQGERAGDPLVREVRVERLELRLGEHALVDQRPRRQAREVGAGLVLRALAQAERAPLQRDPRQRSAVRAVVRRGDEQLAEQRHRGPGTRAQVGPVDVGRDVAPAEHPEVLLGGELLDPRDGGRGLLLVRGQERGADRVRPGGRQREVDHSTQELVRNLDQDADAVPGVVLGAARAAVLEPQQRRETPADDRVAAAAGEVRHQGDTACVVLVLGGVHTGCRGSDLAAGRPVARGSQEFLLSSRCTPTPASGRRGCSCEVWDAPDVPINSSDRGTRHAGCPERVSTFRTAVGQSGTPLWGHRSAWARVRPHAAPRAVFAPTSVARDAEKTPAQDE